MKYRQNVSKKYSSIQKIRLSGPDLASGPYFAKVELNGAQLMLQKGNGEVLKLDWFLAIQEIRSGQHKGYYFVTFTLFADFDFKCLYSILNL